jgi:hypothetical protein
MGDLILFVARHITFRWIDAYGLDIGRQSSGTDPSTVGGQCEGRNTSGMVLKSTAAPSLREKVQID